MSEQNVNLKLSWASIFMFGFCFGAGGLAGVLTLVGFARYARQALVYVGALS